MTEEYIWDLDNMTLSMSALETVLEKAGDKPITMKNVSKHILLDIMTYISTYYTLGETQKDIKEIKEIVTKLGGYK